MARVTVEDCLENVENRFKLVLLAGKRARQLALGTEPLVEWENDKPTVVALREIAEGLVTEETMQASLDAAVADENPFNEDDLAVALHAEISRELNQTDASAKTSAPSPLQNLTASAKTSAPSLLQNLTSGTTSPDTSSNTPTINPFAMPEPDAAASEPPAFGIPNQVPSETSSEATETPSFTPSQETSPESNYGLETPSTSVDTEPKSEPEPFNPSTSVDTEPKSEPEPFNPSTSVDSKPKSEPEPFNPSTSVDSETKSEPEPFNPFADPSPSDEGQDS